MTHTETYNKFSDAIGLNLKCLKNITALLFFATNVDASHDDCYNQDPINRLRTDTNNSLPQTSPLNCQLSLESVGLNWNFNDFLPKPISLPQSCLQKSCILEWTDVWNRFQSLYATVSNETKEAYERDHQKQIIRLFKEYQEQRNGPGLNMMSGQVES